MLHTVYHQRVHHEALEEGLTRLGSFCVDPLLGEEAAASELEVVHAGMCVCVCVRVHAHARARIAACMVCILVRRLGLMTLMCVCLCVCDRVLSQLQL